MILVTGGAGYIGSHVSKDLLDEGYSVIVLDNLSTGHMDAVDKRATLIIGDISDNKLLESIFETYNIEAIMHFAGKCLVGESVQNPLLYYQQNVVKSFHLINKAVEKGIKKFLFSSTCATYGIPTSLPITENQTTSPINPYGNSKLMVEKIIDDVSKTNDLSYIVLRYFNAAGAHLTGEIGECHYPETHLIPSILQHLQGKTNYIEVFGDDYNTPDGTCIRDFIHVLDLSLGHVMALQYLLSNEQVTEIFNLGNEKGYSVLEIINTCEAISGKQANIKIQSRRQGDPPLLVASSEKIKNTLGWKPKYNLSEIIQSAWKWHTKFPNGFGS